MSKPPTTLTRSAGAEEETVRLDRDRLERELFARRGRQGRWRRRRPWLVAALVLALAVAGAWLVLFSPYLTARRVEVTGASYLGADKVRQVAAVLPQTPLARVDTALVLARVRALKAVKDVQVTRVWPRTLRIRVTERVALAVLSRDGQNLGMDEEGVLFRSYSRVPRGLPQISDRAGANREARHEAARAVGSLPSTLLRKVDHVEVRSVDGITLVMRQGKRVVWGSAADSALKAEVLGTLIGQRVGVIDVSVPGRPTTSS